ncbi:MAG: hypothetical protein ACI4R8_02180 [Candidatus Caccovivens sp.]
MVGLTLQEIMEKYFSISKQEFEDYIENMRKKHFNISTLNSIVKAIVPYCTEWLSATDKNGKLVVDEKLKRKAGNVILSKLNFSNFPEWETDYNINQRLNNLFSQTSAKGINTYKIIYCTVLTDGNVYKTHCVDNYNNDYFYKQKNNDGTRDFQNIFSTIQNLLKTTNEETVEIFEKCGATLIGKCDTKQMYNVYNAIKSFGFLRLSEDGSKSYKQYILSEQEVRDILKNTPSLFDSNEQQLYSSFNYINNKIKVVVEQNEDMKPWQKHLQVLRKIFKNNPSLLKLNSEIMQEKEDFLKTKTCYYDRFNNRMVSKYGKAISNLFRDPINIGLMNVIKINDIYNFAIKNLNVLENNGLSNQQISEYIEKNPFMLAMDSVDFADLTKEIIALDKENPDEQYLEKFLKLGRSLFKNTSIIEKEKVLSKLQHGAVEEINIENMTPEDCFYKFLDIFCDDNDLEYRLEYLIGTKYLLDDMGEHQIRENIRKVGEYVSNLKSILKEDTNSVKNKKDEILSLANNVWSISNMRLKLANTDNLSKAKEFEKSISKDIESELNKLRDVFNQKRFHVAKRYSNTDELFENTMNYLDEIFDDKKAIDDLFYQEIVEPFSKNMKELGHSEQNLFGENVTVEVNALLKKPLQSLTDSIMFTQNSNLDNYNFVTKKSVNTTEDNKINKNNSNNSKKDCTK